MLFDQSAERHHEEILSALALEDKWQSCTWPLPNMKDSSEKEFWGWRSCYGWRGEVWVGSVKINDEWATLILYYVGHSQFIGGGFAVAVFREYRKERVEYFTWRACDHVFTSKTIGNCLNRYTCSKCGKSFDVDSSG